MSQVERICAFYSRGPHFARMLRKLRERWPNATIVALVPPTFRVEMLPKEADEAEITTTGKRGARAVTAVCRQIQAGNYDVLVVMFDSPRLRLLAALSGVQKRYCCTVDGRLFHIRLAPFSLLFGTLWRRLRGEFTYRCVRYVVRHRRVPKKESAL